jgi:cytochrome c-type biogenesis protein CcmH
MLLWILIALLSAAAVLAVLLPLGRAPARSDAGSAAGRVYRDQLQELERDRADGRIDAAEFEAARAEIARRLIAADRASPDVSPAPGAGAVRLRRTVAVAALAGIPALSLSLYLTLGAPSLPGQPLAARLSEPTSPNDIETLIAKVEEHLAKAPEDGAGWEVLAPVYLRLGRPADAERAYRNAIRLNGSSAARQTGLGEAIVAGQGGVVTAEAQVAFEAAQAADAAAPGPRFFLALAAEQQGDKAKAAEGWQALLADTPADAPWRPAVQEALARVAPEAPAGSPGPSAEQVTAAAQIDATARNAMIAGMVDGLATGLQARPDDVEGWLRLIRSYSVLERPVDAARAVKTALASVQAPDARARIEALTTELGLPAGGVGP